MSDTQLFRFTATVNGERRSCTLALYENDQDVEGAELVMNNDEPAYREFYRGADEADYEAPLEDAELKAEEL